MSEEHITSEKARFSPPPGAVEIGSAGRLPSRARTALILAWPLYGGALFLPATSNIPGCACLIGILASILGVCMGDLGELHPASQLIPNLFMFLSPLVLFPAMRRGRALRVLRFGSVLGALLALSFPVSLLFHRFRIPECGGMPPKMFQPEIGMYLWVASQILLGAALVVIGRAGRGVK